MASSLQHTYPGYLLQGSSPQLQGSKSIPTLGSSKSSPKRQGKVLGASTVKRYTAPLPAAPLPPAPPSLLPPAPPVVTPTPPEAPPQNVSQPVPAPEYKNPIDEYYESLDRTAPTGDEQADIRLQAQKDMQAYIDAVNNQYAGLLAREQQLGENRSGQTRAINARGGLAGSDFGQSNLVETERYNQENVKALEAERQLKLQEINGKIDQRARDEVAAQKANALGNADKYIGRLAINQESARKDLVTAAKSGAKYDPEKLAALQKQTGYDPLTFESIYNANKPQPEYRAPVQLKDGTLIMTDKQGNVKNLGKYDLPDRHKFMFAPDGTPFVYNEDTGEAKIAEGYHQGQFAKSTAPKDSRTATQKEYEYAIGQGFGGSFLDYKEQVANLDDADEDDLSWLDNLGEED